jgi:2',3'-cyclic-nucleotide 2'-phosphodiesterase (5'-nucleotidase family)
MKQTVLWVTLVGSLVVWSPSTLMAQSSESAGNDEAMPQSSGEVRKAVGEAEKAATETAGEAQSTPGMPATRELTLFSTADTGGSLATPRCRAEDPTGPETLHYARMVRAWRNVSSEASQGQSLAPVAMHLGDSTFPGPIGRFLLADEVAPDGASRLVDQLARIPYASHLLGNAELGIEPSVRSKLLKAAVEGGLPIRAANLVCTPETGGEDVCAAVGAGPEGSEEARYDVVERGDFRIAVVSLLDPEVEGAVAASRMAGLDILSPESQLSHTVDEIQKRQTPVDLIVAQFHAADERSHSRSMQLAQAVEGVDVMVTNASLPGSVAPGGDGRSAQNGYAVVPGTGTVVIGTPGGHSRYVTSTLTLQQAEAGGEASDSDSPTSRAWTVRRVRSRSWTTTGLEPEPETAGALKSIGREFCDKWGTPVAANATLSAPMTRDDFMSYVLNTMRFSAEAEVALMNDGAMANSTTFPMQQDLTLSNIYTALPYNNEMIVARVEGSVLAEWAKKLNGPLAAVGLTADGKVNGRPIRPGRRYRVAVNRFVRGGGDALVDPKVFQKSKSYNPGWSDGAPPISEIVVHYIRSGAFSRRGAVSDRIDPTGNFPDLRRKLFWSFTGSLNASYDQIAVANPGDSYTQSQLTNNNTQQANLELSGAANADSRNHGWDNSLLLQYARARVSQDGQEGSFEETKDLIRGKSAYKFTGIRANLGNAWWAPIPTAELQVESEFDAPDARSWHKLELTGIAGASFRLVEPFEVTIGANIRGDVNAPESATLSGPVSGLAASYKLDRIDLVPLIGSPIKFESELEYFYNDINRDNIHELRNTNRLYYSLFQDLYFTSTFSAFLYQNTAQVGDLGSHTELTFGLNYLWDASVQTF